MKTLLLIYFVVLAKSDPESSTFELITGARERTLDLRMSNLNLLDIAAKTGECVNITVEKASQTAIVEHAVRVVLDCSLLLRESQTFITWHQLNLLQSNATPAGNPLYMLTTSSYHIVTGDRDSFLIIPSTNVIEGARSHGTARYTCMAHTNGDIRLRNTTIFILGSRPYLGRGGCSRAEAAHRLFCDVGVNNTIPLILPQEGVNFVYFECPVFNLQGHPGFGPAYPLPTYTWKKDNVTVFQNEELTAEFYERYPELALINPSPFTYVNEFSFEVDFGASNSSGMNEVPVNCSNHFVYAEMRNYIMHSIVGTWQCVVENIYGEDTGELTILEKDQCSENNTALCDQAQCITAAGEFCCNCPLNGYTYGISGTNCRPIPTTPETATTMSPTTTTEVPVKPPCVDMLMSHEITSSYNITIESTDNLTFIGTIDCADNEQPSGSLKCRVNESGKAVVVEESLQCVVEDNVCFTICIIVPAIVGAVFLLLIIILLVIWLVCCYVNVGYKHRYFPSKTVKVVSPKNDPKMMPLEKYIHKP